MSDLAVSALAERRSDGAVSVSDAGLRGMITLRGDLSSGALKKAVSKTLGLNVPAQRAMTTQGAFAVAWMSPDELLILTPHAEAAEITSSLARALSAQHALVLNVSDARAILRIEGPGVREVIAKLAPVDMSAAAFQPGQIRRTRLAQIAAAFWIHNATTIELICFRSVAQYAFDLLEQAAENGPVDFLDQG